MLRRAVTVKGRILLTPIRPPSKLEQAALIKAAGRPLAKEPPGTVTNNLFLKIEPAARRLAAGLGRTMKLNRMTLARRERQAGLKTGAPG